MDILLKPCNDDAAAQGVPMPILHSIPHGLYDYSWQMKAFGKPESLRSFLCSFPNAVLMKCTRWPRKCWARQTLSKATWWASRMFRRPCCGCIRSNCYAPNTFCSAARSRRSQPSWHKRHCSSREETPPGTPGLERRTSPLLSPRSRFGGYDICSTLQ
jgi:hypothetical protein